MEQLFYCTARDLVIKIFKVRKHLIRWDKDKKGITLVEIEILEQKFELIMSDKPAAEFIIKYYDLLLFYIQPNNHEWITKLNDLLYHSKEITDDKK